MKIKFSTFEEGKQFLMKKIGLITFYNTIGYGTILQAYATKQIIQRMGYECDIIPYYNKYMEKSFSIKHTNVIRDCYVFFSQLFLFLTELPRKNKFYKFRDTFAEKPYLGKDDMEKLNGKYDIFLCGSDQLWNYNITDMDEIFLLSFVKDNEKKRAFSTSFGLTEIEEEKKEVYINYLKSFYKVALREEQGQDLFYELTQKETDLVLDPTFLYGQKSWNQLIEAERKKEKSKYILVYQMIISKKLIKVAEFIRKKTGYKVIWIPFPYGKGCKCDIELTAGPLEWLTLVKNAELVLTNSFHGVAFSIIFNRQFYCLASSKLKKTSSRVLSVLKIFNLEKRLIDDEKEICISRMIDYNMVNTILEEKRQESLKILEKILND